LIDTMHQAMGCHLGMLGGLQGVAKTTPTYTGWSLPSPALEENVWA